MLLAVIKLLNLEHTLTATFNDLDSVQALYDQYGDAIAAIILEPVAGNMNMILPEPGFLEGLRELCDAQGSLLIIDEVMTGFRIHSQGAQGLYGVNGDITTFGKIIGGGMPVGAFGGRADIMEQLSPEGPVYQAGTLSGNPLAMAAGLAVLQLLNDDAYAYLNKLTERFVSGLQRIAEQAQISLAANYLPGMFGVFFTDARTVTDYATVMACDKERFVKFFHGCLNHGIYIAPSAFEAGFISLAHTEADIDQTLDVMANVLKTL